MENDENLAQKPDLWFGIRIWHKVSETYQTVHDHHNHWLVKVLNGVESLIKQLKTQEFLRIRVGISPHTPGWKLKKPSGEKAVLDFLLKDFKDAEITELKKVSKKIKESLDMFMSDGKDKMMSLYNG